MGDTTSNQGKAIVTQGTKHVAKNPSVCDPCVSTSASPQVKPFKNEIPSSKLAAGKTTKTKIKGDAIMNQNTYIGPPSTGDEPPWMIGQKSGVIHNNWAKADQWSPDVKAEGGFVVRTNDRTQQNANNSTGYMDGSQLDGDETTVQEYAELKCTMNKLEGTSGKKKLWKKSESATQYNYMEILSGKTVDFVSERIDATDITGDPAIDPPCALEPKHTIWRITRTGGGQEKKEAEASGKKYTLPSDITDVSSSFNVSLSNDGKFQLEGSGVGVTGGGGEANTLAKGATPAGVREVSQSEGATVTTDVGAIWTFLKFRGSPCMVQVDAVACAGPKTAWIRIFPDPPLKLTLKVGEETEDKTSVGQSGRNDFLDWVYTKFGKLRSLCNKIAQLVGLAGDIEFHFKMFVGFQLDVEVGYKDCEKTLTTRAGDWRSAEAHCGLYWSLKVSSGPLIEFGITVKIPVVAIAAAFFSGPAASLVVRVLRKIEDIVGEFNLEFTAKIGVDLDFTAECDQHEVADAGGTVTIKPELEIALALRVPDRAEARAGGTLAGEVTIGNRIPPPTHFLKLVSTGKLTFTVWAEAKVMGRVLWIGPKYEFSGRKEFKVFEWEMWKGSADLIRIGRRATA
jgi:hypothetical protein